MKKILEATDSLVEVVVDTATGNRYYIFKLSDNKFTVVFVQRVTEAMRRGMEYAWRSAGDFKGVLWRVKTVLVDRPNNRQFFRSLDDALDAAEDQAEGALDQVNC